MQISGEWFVEPWSQQHPSLLVSTQVVDHRDLGEDDRHDHDDRGRRVQRPQEEEREAEPRLEGVQHLVLEGDGQRDDEEGEPDTSPRELDGATERGAHPAVLDHHQGPGEARSREDADHLAIALVTKDEDGKLKVDRHNTSAKHLAWGGGILGAAATAISAPLGVVFLGPLAVSAAVWAGVGGLVGHFWKNIPKDELAKMSDILESATTASW